MLVGCAVERERPACVDCTAQGVHPADFARTHGKELEQRGFDFATCQRCHGEDFAGKATAPSCLSCHQKGPTACDTCHGDPPTTAAHPAHLARFSCSDCHVVPATWVDHKPIAGHARVAFSAFAGAAPAWDSATGTCSNVYCHGDARPIWTGGPAQAACGTCHRTPPPSHVQTECASCHPSSRHIDGVVDIGNGSGTCSACHGSVQSPVPATGAHRAHLQGGFFSQPIACSECHLVPAAVTDPGHLDSAPPAEIVFGPIATAHGATPVWDRTAATCTNVYCHGPSTPSWTGTARDNAYCGSCHGLPPATAAHSPTMSLTDCATCHPASVSPYGGILVGNGKHMNGVIDAQ